METRDKNYYLILSKWYYKKLQCEVEIANLEGISLEQLCERIGGHNFDGELFDVNYGSICATVICRNGIIKLSNNVEVWGDDCIDDDYDMREPMYILKVEYKNKENGDIYSRDYVYNGCTDRTKTQWITDAEKVAFGNQKDNEDVMRFDFFEVE